MANLRHTLLQHRHSEYINIHRSIMANLRNTLPQPCHSIYMEDKDQYIHGTACKLIVIYYLSGKKTRALTRLHWCAGRYASLIIVYTCNKNWKTGGSSSSKLHYKKPCFMPAHSHSLISINVIRSLETIVSKACIARI